MMMLFSEEEEHQEHQDHPFFHIQQEAVDLFMSTTNISIPHTSS